MKRSRFSEEQIIAILKSQESGVATAELRQAMKAVAAERRRFGYRRVHVMLERQGWRVNQKKLRRL